MADELCDMVTTSWVEKQMGFPQGSIINIDVVAPESSEGFLGSYYYVTPTYSPESQAPKVTLASHLQLTFSILPRSS